ncbi:hypothetical protein VOLCADRAFT_33849, partial [Volvox carteri f. nagariensis]
PPVIFNAGLSVEQRLFFSNLPSILSFGVLGTLVSFVLMSAATSRLFPFTPPPPKDCLALGAVFAATDSVAVLGLLDPRTNPQLFSLVFGEGIVNDATSVVLLGALARMIKSHSWGIALLSPSPPFPFPLFPSTKKLGGVLLREVCMCVCAFFARTAMPQEVAVVGLLSYLAYLAAEVLGLSAILSLFCCGATVSHFALRN